MFYKTDFLAFSLLGHRKRIPGGNGSDFVLRIRRQREQHPGKLLLTQMIKHIALVLAGIGPLEKKAASAVVKFRCV